MRQRDLELLDSHLKPLHAASDRNTSDLNGIKRVVEELSDRVKDLERGTETHSLEIAQGLASIRSLLQRASRAARETGIIEEAEQDLVDRAEKEGNPIRSRDDVVRAARARSARSLM